MILDIGQFFKIAKKFFMSFLHGNGLYNIKDYMKGGKMLSVNSYDNSSPSFGKLYISKNSATKKALERCSQETLDSIIKAGEMMEMTSFLDGVIKKIGNRLVFRVSVPKGFEFPNGLAYKPGLQFIKDRTSKNGHYKHKLLRYGSFINNGDTVVINGEDSLKLKKVNNKNGTIEYEIQSDFDTADNYSGIEGINLRTLVKKIIASDYDLKELAGGRLKLKPFPTKVSKQKITAAKPDEAEALKLHKSETLDYLLSKF